MNNHKSQCQRLLALLEANLNEWVPLPKILELRIASHTRRLHELRKTHQIDIADYWHNGQRQTAYRLVKSTEA